MLRKLVCNSERGQALVETSLVLPVILLVILLMLDPAFMAFNLAIAKIHSFNAAREASIWMAGGSGTCAARAAAVAEPAMLFGQATGTLSVTPCPADPYWVTPTGSKVTASYDVTYDPLFWPGDAWFGTMTTMNVFQ